MTLGFFSSVRVLLGMPLTCLWALCLGREPTQHHSPQSLPAWLLVLGGFAELRAVCCPARLAVQGPYRIFMPVLRSYSGYTGKLAALEVGQAQLRVLQQYALAVHGIARPAASRHEAGAPPHGPAHEPVRLPSAPMRQARPWGARPLLGYRPPYAIGRPMPRAQRPGARQKTPRRAGFAV